MFGELLAHECHKVLHPWHLSGTALQPAAASNIYKLGGGAMPSDKNGQKTSENLRNRLEASETLYCKGQKKARQKHFHWLPEQGKNDTSCCFCQKTQWGWIITSLNRTPHCCFCVQDKRYCGWEKVVVGSILFMVFSFKTAKEYSCELIWCKHLQR